VPAAVPVVDSRTVRSRRRKGSTGEHELGRRYTAPEIDFIRMYPGGFDRLFFEKHLPEMLADYADEQELDTLGTVEVIFTLVDGRSFRVMRITSALTWLTLWTEQEELVSVPHRDVASVIARRRAGPPPRHPVGFRVTPLDG
jgi:hypothetical protein